ncbi:Protein kinase-like domain [Lasallia pustulata]|uniref:Protein kinase-like domain n=1 Tax=Lasallia pustulata TaxID=136370 RepID=A0A1W5CV39_9LECA|nr:Protein kinase-like domain [Lasallia pustulata]
MVKVKLTSDGVVMPVLESLIAASVWPIGDGQWALGGSMLCERIADGVSAPSDTITTWKDGQGVDYCLRPLTTRLPIPPYDENGIIQSRLVSFFDIGHDVFIKVKYKAADDRSTEAEAMRLVRERAPSVPVPEPIYSWHDKELERTFLITRRVHGKVVDDVWHSLKDEDREQVAKELAAYQKSLAEITAPAFQDVGGHHLAERYLLPDYDERVEPFTADELREQLRKASNGIEPPEFGPEFHLFHRDMSAENVILSGTDEARTEGKSHVHVAGIVGWRYAGFYPKFWITTFPCLPIPKYTLSATEEQLASPERTYWIWSYMQSLDRAMVELGFQNGLDGRSWWIKHHEAMGKPHPYDL